MELKTIYNNDIYTINSNIGKEFSKYEILYREFNIRNFICHRNNIISIL